MYSQIESYIEPVFRPPSEAYSYILQLTNGCSWNQCTFCEMYSQPQKKFSFKSFDEIKTLLDSLKKRNPDTRRIFLADGDALTLSCRRLQQVLGYIQKLFPNINRISCYCLPRNLLNKNLTDMLRLKQSGLKMVYVGCESGDDEVLKLVHKGETYLSQKRALNLLKDAGIKTSVMILNGLGGTKYSQQHAIHSAHLMNECQPDYLSTLVVSFPMGEKRFQQGFNGFFQPLSQHQLFQEMEIFISELKLDSTIFRSDHASNYLILKGILNKDKSRLLSQLQLALNQPNNIPLRQEWQRGL